MSSRDFAERLAFEQLEPWTYGPLDHYLSQICRLLAESLRDPEKRQKPFEPADFMPDFLRPEAPEQEPEAVEDQLLLWMRTYKQMLEMNEKREQAVRLKRGAGFVDDWPGSRNQRLEQFLEPAL